jgi:hypothetical protein
MRAWAKSRFWDSSGRKGEQMGWMNEAIGKEKTTE